MPTPTSVIRTLFYHKSFWNSQQLPLNLEWWILYSGSVKRCRNRNSDTWHCMGKNSHRHSSVLSNSALCARFLVPSAQSSHFSCPLLFGGYGSVDRWIRLNDISSTYGRMATRTPAAQKCCRVGINHSNHLSTVNPSFSQASRIIFIRVRGGISLTLSLEFPLMA